VKTKIIYIYTHTHTHTYKETVVSALKLLQYFQLPDKNYIYIYTHTHTHTYIYIYTYKETLVSALRLLKYFQLQDKTSRDISRYIYNFCAVFQNSYVFILLFISEPLTVVCGPVRFGGTLLEKHRLKTTGEGGDKIKIDR
jgi:hypothetical protein